MIADAKEIAVNLSNGEAYRRVYLLSANEQKALLRIEATDVPTVALGNSNESKPGGRSSLDRSTTRAGADGVEWDHQRNPHPVTISSIEVFNQVESDGMVYTITCSANWVGSKCSWLIPGDIFLAETQGTTMWITGGKGGNSPVGP